VRLILFHVSFVSTVSAVSVTKQGLLVHKNRLI